MLGELFSIAVQWRHTKLQAQTKVGDFFVLTAVREGPGNRNYEKHTPFPANNSTLSKDDNTSLNHLIDFYASRGGTFAEKDQPVNDLRDPLS